MTKNKWLLVAVGAALIFLGAAYFLFADNKAEVITMVIAGVVAVLAANASGRVKIKELGG
jgi:uncharacterized membrane protein HdeD (DUF308 family)